jgi:hypothetical protein
MLQQELDERDYVKHAKKLLRRRGMVLDLPRLKLWQGEQRHDSPRRSAARRREAGKAFGCLV